MLPRNPSWQRSNGRVRRSELKTNPEKVKHRRKQTIPGSCAASCGTGDMSNSRDEHAILVGTARACSRCKLFRWAGSAPGRSKGLWRRAYSKKLMHRWRNLSVNFHARTSAMADAINEGAGIIQRVVKQSGDVAEDLVEDTHQAHEAPSGRNHGCDFHARGYGRWLYRLDDRPAIARRSPNDKQATNSQPERRTPPPRPSQTAKTIRSGSGS